MKNILSLGVLIILLIWSNASWAASISGTRLVCTGSTTTLSIDTTGGAWSSSNAARATVDASTGVVTGITNGSVVISYTAGTDVFTAVVSVNATPIAIVGAAAVCEGANLSLSNPMGGGTWSSADAAIGSVGASTGIVRGIAAGDVTITYHYWNGCNTTKNITVNPAPAAFSGSLAFCAGATSTLSSSPSGGTWTSSNNAVATVNASGVVTGVIGGLSVISYTTSGACKTGATVTVANAPAAITGNTTICAGSTSMLASATAGGAWSSANTAVATVGTNGLVTGVSPGTAIITYGFGSGCARTTTVTVTTPISAISGAEVLCAGLATTYTNATTGGTWTSSNTARLTISAATGMASAVSAGTATITYRTSTACFITKNVTVNTALAAITGGTSVCMGATATLSHPVSGSTWTSSNTARATIDAATGAVTGVSLGTAVITYTIGAACFKTITINVTALSSAITGTATVCEGGITTLTNATAGGSWSSSNPAVATVAYSVGNVTGVATGTATISYTLGSGCAATRVVTVSAGIAPFTGATAVCTGFSSTLATTTTGGTWSSSNTARATINAAGLVTGLTAGTVVISYAKAGCVRTTVFTVSGAPSAISGTATVCVGNSTTLSATAGGSWTSANTSIASIGSSSGVMTGVAAGTTTISYTITGCTVTRIVTINETPSTITGTLAGCVGTTATLSSTPAGGSWTSSNTAIATVDAAGVVTNLLAGVSNIVYTLPDGCSKTAALTVNAAPAAISGADAICNGTSASYTSATSGGAWTSSNTAVATVGTGGMVTALSAGTATLTYGVGSCITTKTITVNNAPAAITGGTTVCAGATTMLANATAGGSWASANTAVATVGSTGMVTGVSAGTATISYTASGCGVAMVITVNNTPAAISGADAICNGTSASYTSATSGGAWTSSNTAVATVGTGGVVTALSAGTAMLTYGVGSCITTKTITVNNAPAAITGGTTVCAGATTMLANTTAGGSWASANTAVATVGSTGMVTGVSAGTATISYTASGCGVAMVITVNNTPAAISGADAICNGTSASYTSATSGGAWTSSNTAVATVGTGGVVTAMSAGTTTLTYGVGSCITTKTITVNNAPAAITGSTTVCAGATTMLANATAGGSWASANTAVATVGSTGMVTGVSAGTATVSYTLAGGCTATTVVSVNATAPITGPSSIAIGGTATLANAIAGGSWSSDKEFVATVGATTGVVSGVSAGSCAISYALPSGCAVVRDITVSSGCTISGTLAICRSTTSALSASVSGGTWSSSTTSVATVNGSTGVVSGVNAGTATISYNSGTGCTSSVVVTINANPATIGGPSMVCGSDPISFTNVTAGGSWASSNTALATIGSTTGVLTAAAAGTVVITYTLPTGCRSTKSVTLITSLSPISVTGGNRCEGNLFNVGNVIMGGTWTAADTTVATLVTTFDNYASFRAMNAGITNINITAPGGCTSSVSVTTNTSPAVISGGSAVCIGATTTLNTTPAGGTWTSSNAGIVSVGSATGVVSGDGLGTATITYTLTNGCNRTNNMFVGGPGSAGVIYAPNILEFGEHAYIEYTGYGGSLIFTDTSIITNPNYHNGCWPMNPGTTTIMYTTAIGSCAPDTASVTVTVPDNICSKELVALKGNLFRTGGIDGFYNVKNLYLSGEYSDEMFGVVTSLNYSLHGYHRYNGGGNLKIFKTNGDKTIFLRNNINEARWGDAIHRTPSGRIFGIMYNNINVIDAYEVKDTGYVYSVVETALTDTYYPTVDNYRSFQLTSSLTDTVYVSYINYIEGAVYVKKYNGTSWELVGAPIHDTNIYEISAFKITTEGELMLSYITLNPSHEETNTKLKVIKYNGAEWINVTNINRTTPYSEFISYIKDDKNIVAVFSNEILQYNGTEWNTIGELESFSTDYYYSYDYLTRYGDIDINSDNSVTIALPRSSSNIELKIYKYDGTSWNDISINNVSLTFSKIELSHTINGDLYIGFQGTELKYPIYERERTMIFKFNGTNWLETPGDDYIDVNESSQISTIFSNNTPIVGYLNLSGYTDYGAELKNKIWDGTRWKNINLPYNHSTRVNQFKLFKDSSETIYQVVSTRGAGNKLDMYRYHDSGWSRIGSSSITPAGVNSFDAVCGSGSMPWIIFKDSTMANATTIKKYNGSSWVAVSSTGLPVFKNKISLAFDTAGIAYVAGKNQYTNKITAYKFNGSSWVAIDSNKWIQGYTPQLAFTNRGMMLTYVGENHSYNFYVYAKLISDTFSSKFAQDSMLGLGSDWYTIAENFDFEYNLSVDKIGTPYITGSYKVSDNTHISQFVLSGNCWVVNDLGRGALFFDKHGTNVSTNFDSSNRMYISGLFFCPLENYSSPVYLPSVYKYENKSIKGDSIICANQINTFKAQKFTYEGIPNSYPLGTWSISNPAVARITPYVFNSYDYGLEISHTGYVTGLAPGTATISFTYPGGCVLTKTITVNGVPSMPTVSGGTTVAVGGSTTLSASTSGGDWYSSNNAVASVGSTGVVTGVSAGSVVITYIKFEECGMTYDLHTVNVTPARPTVVNNADAADMFHAYPNPTKGALFVNTATTGTLSMTTLDGKEVSNWKLSTGETALTLPKSLATGLYICKFIGTDGATKIVRLVYEQ